MSTIRGEFSIFHRIFNHPAQIISAIGTWLKRIRNAWQARAAIRGLLTHDDHLLSDIGVSRSDVEQALAVRWDKDPADALADIRRRRSQADRQRRIA